MYIRAKTYETSVQNVNTSGNQTEIRVNRGYNTSNQDTEHFREENGAVNTNE